MWNSHRRNQEFPVIPNHQADFPGGGSSYQFRISNDSQGTWCVKMCHTEESSSLRHSVDTSLSFHQWMNLPDLINGSTLLAFLPNIEQSMVPLVHQTTVESLIFQIWENLAWFLSRWVEEGTNPLFTSQWYRLASIRRYVKFLPPKLKQCFSTLKLTEEFLN